MGCEPFLDAMFGAPDFNVVVGGRAYDPSPYVAFCALISMGAQQVPMETLGEERLGGFFHMGKIMECGGQCATPKSKSALATVYQDGTFVVKPLNTHAKCTPISVAAHTLYEKSRPDLLYGPGGCLDLTQSAYVQQPDDRSILVSGALFKIPSTFNSKYTVKLEAANITGYRAIFIGAMRDPILTGQIDSFLGLVREYVREQHVHIDEHWQLGFHKFGALGDNIGNGVGEIFIVGEALAPNQDLANSLASTARIACVHGPYPGQKATSGNLAMGIGGKMEIEMGECASFCIYHLMDLNNGEQGAKALGNAKEMTGVLPNDVDAIENDNSIFGGVADKVRPLFSWKQVIVGENILKYDNGIIGELSITPTPSLAKNSISISKGARDGGDDIERRSPRTLGDIAHIVRSKNSGPFEITFDVLFNLREVYLAVKGSSLLSSAVISELFDIKEGDIIFCGFFDQALAFKATLPRTTGGLGSSSGGFMENDVHASQQYLPLMGLQLPQGLTDVLVGVL
ncbi:hypothetical protein D0Z07_6078 [Hyphodiscus hymeniophilus]|uniref:Uncharacterized protein n=1 Tax=Hyphodiscus hymeniophilus TaxID=353542 RepID=A0A9P7AW19_9HELO|nr:hypothetical protein D0Z07_6078 [Hyphodiscus hymeniophilus]